MLYRGRLVALHREGVNHTGECSFCCVKVRFLTGSVLSLLTSFFLLLVYELYLLLFAAQSFLAERVCGRLRCLPPPKLIEQWPPVALIVLVTGADFNPPPFIPFPPRTTPASNSHSFRKAWSPVSPIICKAIKWAAKARRVCSGKAPRGRHHKRLPPRTCRGRLSPGSRRDRDRS